jgi:hypothetical protein
VTNLLFEISTVDVQALDDTDARLLVAKLCEAELAAAGVSPHGVIAGGAQTAPDGGSDVHVTVADPAFTPGFIPQPETVYQVKAERMPKGRISGEMKPKGVLRPLIGDLASRGGAYVIVSTRDNLTDPSITSRRSAMASAAGVVGALRVDFYDAARLVTWINLHPAVALWVRFRLGRATAGWQPFGPWSTTAAGDGFIVDEKARLRQRAASTPLAIPEGLAKLREALVKPGAAVRLVGLSGHGKTRLAQALFEETALAGALPSSEVIYGDVGRGLEPSPRAVAEQLAGLGRRAILVVDNCPGSVHRALADVMQRPGSHLSLLTVEYDVGEDDFEDTAEFRLESASDDLVEQLLKQRGFDLSDPDRRTIAGFAGGNTRVALALARSAGGKGTLAALSDAELLDRLFGRATDDRTRKVADVAALVVSFDGETLDDAEPELPVLAGLAGLSVDDFHAAVVELQDRELIQRRGIWRALLPQALAVRLAKDALKRLLPNRVWSALVDDAPVRLLSSFAHRLGLLHDNPQAVGLADQLLTAGGLLGDPSTLNEIGAKAFAYLAPASPAAALAAIERALSGPNPDALTPSHPHRDDFGKLTRSLAYEPPLFARAIEVLAMMAQRAKPDDTHKGWETFDELFWLVLSGTQASPAQRFAVVDGWIAAGRMDLATRALKAALQAAHFSSGAAFDFGARQRDYGWRPKLRKDTFDWYAGALQSVAGLSAIDAPAAGDVLASRFREVWGHIPPVRPALLALARTVAGADFHKGLWFELCETLAYDREPGATADRLALKQLEADLRPVDLGDLFEAYVLSPAWDWHDPAGGDPSAAMAAAAARAKALGANAVSNPATLDLQVPKLFSARQDQSFSYGQGLAAAQAGALEAGWHDLRRRLAAAVEAEPNVQLLRGYVVEALTIDARQVQVWLDEALHDPVLGRHFMNFQASAPIDGAAIERLLRALDLGHVHPQSYMWLAGGGALDGVPIDDLKRLLLRLTDAPGGAAIAIDLFGMRLFSEKHRAAATPGLAELGRALLLNHAFVDTSAPNLEHHLGELADFCLRGPAGTAAARTVARRLKAAVVKGLASRHNYAGVASALFRRQSSVALNTFLDGVAKNWWRLESLVVGLDRDDDDARPNLPRPIALVAPATCLAWVGRNPETRTRLIAQAIPFSERDDLGGLQWTPLARALIGGPFGVQALDGFAGRFLPGFGWGSMAARVLARRPLLEEMAHHTDPAIATRAVTLVGDLDIRIAQLAAMDHDPTDQTFE